MRKKLILATLFTFICITSSNLYCQILTVKAGKSAIVKIAPEGNAEQFTNRLPEGTEVQKLGDVPKYYYILLTDGRKGWSYKGNFVLSDPNGTLSVPQNIEVTTEGLLSRPDVLQIIVIDVEVGDATLIICPEENGNRDILLIDTGENDSDRIKTELTGNGFALSNSPITRFFITHYDSDHCGDAPALVTLSEVVYDHGNNNIKTSYLNAVSAPGVDRRMMTLNYQETFSGGVEVECVAVNQATDFNSEYTASSPNDNPNSIALIISFDHFDYFTGGDLTKEPEKSLATGIKNCDVYHVNHHGSRSTSSDIDFVTKLNPEVSVVSNGTSYGHPTNDVAQRLLGIGSVLYQTNINPDSRAYHPDAKYIADDTYTDDNEAEDLEGATGTIKIVVDPVADKYYVVMPGLLLNEATFDIET